MFTAAADAAGWNSTPTADGRNVSRLEYLQDDAFAKKDVALTYSYDDGAFYVIHLPGAEILPTVEVPESYAAYYSTTDTPLGPSEILAIHTKSNWRIPPGIEEPEATDGNIIFRKLSPEHHTKFVAARDKVAKSLLNASALELMTLHESAEFERWHPECVLDSLWTERWKTLTKASLWLNHVGAW